MGRPSDWWVLDLPGDPVPGEPETVAAVARRWAQVADDADLARGQVSSLLGDDAVISWLGKAGEAFRSHSSKLPGQLAKCADSYAQAASALSWWSGRLAAHQHQADRALAQGREARADLDAAQTRLSSAQADDASAQASVSSLHAAARTAAAQQRSGDIPAPDPDAVRAAASRAAAASQAVSHAQAAVGDAQARLDAAKRLAGEAAQLRDGDASSTSRRLHDAADAGIGPDSFWHKVGSALSHAWHAVVEIAKVVVAIGAIVALVVGGPIAWIVVAAGAIVFADTLAKYLQGKASLWDVALSALACIPVTEGLTSVSALSSAFREGGLLGAGAHLLTSGVEALKGMASSVRSMASNVRTALRDLSESRTAVGAAHEIPAPVEGMTVYRVYGPARAADGTPLMAVSKDGGTYPLGSRPFGESWTPKDPRLSGNFRRDAGLPDENPATFVVEGNLRDPSAVYDVRPALELDGQPGGWPEYLIRNAGDAVEVTSVGGVNEPWTTPPGGWDPTDG